MKYIKSAASTLCLMMLCCQNSKAEKIADFRIEAQTPSGVQTYYDYAFGPVATRSIENAPFQLPVEFTVSSSQPSLGSGDPLTDARVRTFSTLTRIVNFNRFGTSPNPTPDNEAVGTLQLKVDFSPIEDFLTNNPTASLSALELQFNLDLSDEARAYDIYLSYTNPAESITLTNISEVSGQENYQMFWNPVHVDPVSAVGDIVNGTHKVINLDQLGDLDERTDLLNLYQAGVREVNVIISMASFFNGRSLNLLEGSGINANLGAGVERISDFRLDGAYPTERASDVHGPLPTLVPSPTASLSLPTSFLMVSQTQGGNSTPPQDLTVFDLDNSVAPVMQEPNRIGANLNPKTASLVGYGDFPDGIGNTAFDLFEYAAWRVNGDFDITVQIDSLTSVETSAVAGFMLRESGMPGSPHVFFGARPDGQVMIVLRETQDTDASTQLFSVESFPIQIRIVRNFDTFDFYLPTSLDPNAASPISSLNFTVPDELFFGPAVSSFSQMNPATAEFSMLPVLPDPNISNTDVAISTTGQDQIDLLSLNRFGGGAGGMPQWVIDLSPLNGTSPEALNLVIDFANSEPNSRFDFYLSYTNAAESISFTPIRLDNPIVNREIFFDPSRTANEGDVVNGTHKLIAKDLSVGNAFDTYDLNVDLLPLLEAGVDQVALSMATDSFFRGRAIRVSETSGVFIEMGASLPNIRVSDISIDGGNVRLDISDLTENEVYHIERSSDLISGFVAIPGSQFSAGSGMNTVNVLRSGDRSFLRVVLGPEPSAAP